MDSSIFLSLARVLVEVSIIEFISRWAIERTDRDRFHWAGRPFEAQGELEAGATKSAIRENGVPRFEGTAGLELFGAVGDPEDVIKLLRMARVGVIGAFVLVLDLGTCGLRCRPLFSSCVGGAAIDGTTGGLWKGGVGEG